MINPNNKVKRITLISILSAASFLLMLISVPIIPYVPFLKLDFSDLPILLGLLILGPVGAVEATLLKLFLYWMLMGFSLPELIGVFTSFVASLVMILVFSWTRKYLFKSWCDDCLIVAGETVALTIVMALLNWLVTTPLYMHLVGMKLDMPLAKMILFGVVPFNLIKGLIIGGLFVILARQMKKWVK